jgi:hypothetical protein
MNAPVLFTIPAGTPQAACRSCHAEIYWVKTKAGKNMPASIGGPGCFAPEENEDGLGISHFADCEQADQHRKPRTL